MSKARRRSAPRGAVAARPAARPRAGPADVARLDLVIVMACVALALWVQRRALGGFFSLDDLVIIEEVRGLREAAVGPWRLLSRHLYFGAAVPLFGSNPFPYHLVSALVHAANVGLLYVWIRRRSGTMLAAAAGAAIFGASRLHMTALGSAATIGEPLALALALGAFLLHDHGGRSRLVAAALYLGALLSKESVVLLPLVLLVPRPGGPPFRTRLRETAPLLALGVAFAVTLLVAGTAGRQLGGEAYARGYGTNLFMNLMTYARWVADPLNAFPGQVSAIDPGAWPIGIAATVALALAAWLARRAAPPPALGLLWWFLALAPVLPLIHHTYLYYLYVPLAGLALLGSSVASRVEAWCAAHRAGALPIVRAAAIAILFAHALLADRLLERRYSAHMPGTGIPLDPDLRKSEIARHAVAGVSKRLAGDHARVAFLLPAGLEQVYSAGTGERKGAVTDSAGGYRMLAGALDDGAGLRALVPVVDTVVFLDGWRGGHEAFELFSQAPDGTVFPLGRGADGFAEAASALIASGHREPARRLLEGALSEFPDHAPLRYQQARWHYFSGDSLAMRRELEELLRRAPDHPLAERVRSSIPGRGRGK